MTKIGESDSPQVIAPPPLIFVGGLVLGLILRLVTKPIDFFPDGFAVLVGTLLVIAGIGLIRSSVKAFKKAKTNFDIRKSTTAIVGDGPYRFTRNPMYLSMVFLYVGIAAFFNDAWLLIALIPALFVIEFGVIRREERYLAKKFGEVYTNYKNSVRRWL